MLVFYDVSFGGLRFFDVVLVAVLVCLRDLLFVFWDWLFVVVGCLWAGFRFIGVVGWFA